MSREMEKRAEQLKSEIEHELARMQWNLYEAGHCEIHDMLDSDPVSGITELPVQITAVSPEHPGFTADYHGPDDPAFYGDSDIPGEPDVSEAVAEYEKMQADMQEYRAYWEAIDEFRNPDTLRDMNDPDA